MFLDFDIFLVFLSQLNFSGLELDFALALEQRLLLLEFLNLLSELPQLL